MVAMGGSVPVLSLGVPDTRAREGHREQRPVDMAALDDPDRRSALLSAIGHCDTRAAAAEHVGLAAKTLTRYCKAHPDFGKQVDAMFARKDLLKVDAPRALTKAQAAHADVVINGVDADEMLSILMGHARDSKSRGCPEALRILSALAFTEQLLAAKEAAKAQHRAAGEAGAGPIVVRVPAPQGDVVEAEIVESEPN